MLSVPDAWTVFADRYLDALDEITRVEARKPASSRSNVSYPDSDFVRKDRTCDLAEWHALLLERLAGSEAEDRLDRLVGHPALGGPELTFVLARLAELRGDAGTARDLAQECLQRLPGHQGSLSWRCASERNCPRSPGTGSPSRHAWKPQRRLCSGPAALGRNFA